MYTRMQIEQHMLAQVHRLPGLNSSYAALDTLLNRDEDITFEDYLNGKIHFSLTFKTQLKVLHFLWISMMRWKKNLV